MRNRRGAVAVSFVWCLAVVFLFCVLSATQHEQPNAPHPAWDTRSRFTLHRSIKQSCWRPSVQPRWVLLLLRRLRRRRRLHWRRVVNIRTVSRRHCWHCHRLPCFLCHRECICLQWGLVQTICFRWHQYSAYNPPTPSPSPPRRSSWASISGNHGVSDSQVSICSALSLCTLKLIVACGVLQGPRRGCCRPRFVPRVDQPQQ